MQLGNFKLPVIEIIIDVLKNVETEQQFIQVIEDYEIDLMDLAQYHHFGDNRYGRNLIFSNAQFEVILMCWGPSQGAAAHDHSNSLCVMKCVSGELEEQHYRTVFTKGEVSPSIIPTVLNKLKQGETCSITDQQGLHSIKNNGLKEACSLHFYFPPIHQAQVYNLANGDKKQVSSVFTSEYGIKK